MKFPCFSLFAMVTALVGAAAVAEDISNHPFFDEPLYVGAHRGGADLWPENTVLAYERCAEKWPDILLEADVYETADGHLVVLHDGTVDRTTDGTGKVGELTLDEIKSLDAGHDFTADGETHPYRGQGLTIPTLEEALKAAPEHRWLVEPKRGSSVMEKTVAVIKELGMEDQVLLASFTPAHMAYAREHAPEIARCFDFTTGAAMLAAANGDWESYEPPDHVLSLMRRMINQFSITPELLEKIESKGVVTQIHTVNDREEMDTMLEFGFDSILSDRPDLLADAVGDFNGGAE